MNTAAPHPLRLLTVVALVSTLGSPAPMMAEAKTTTRSAAVPQDVGAFHDYWSQGRAEITSYTLEQARYGEMHSGHAVTIFVTEDFSRSKQVKLDAPGAAADDRVPVLKLNATRKFNTGVYPYSVMASVFTPFDGTPTLKVTTSIQEWCGQVFSQVNRGSEGYSVLQRSYFESEGDRELQLGDVELEDSLWNLLRISPRSLPVGEVSLVPGSVQVNMGHLPWRAEQAKAEHLPPNGEGHWGYRVTYPRIERTLTIWYSGTYPHTVESWQESTSGQITRAVKNKRKMLDYWSKNRLRDADLRRELGLP